METTISVSKETRNRLNALKYETDVKSIDEVINNVLDEVDEIKKEKDELIEEVFE